MRMMRSLTVTAAIAITGIPLAQARDLPVAVNNTPDVNVVNTPNVNVLSLPGPVSEQQTVKPYLASSICESNGSAADSLCYFDVPAGRLLIIEKITGFSRKGNVTYLSVQTQNFNDTTYLVPKTYNEGINYFFDADGIAYAEDNDFVSDSSSTPRDLRIIVNTDGAGDAEDTARLVVSGRLVDSAP